MYYKFEIYSSDECHMYSHLYTKFSAFGLQGCKSTLHVHTTLACVRL